MVNSSSKSIVSSSGSVSSAQYTKSTLDMEKSVNENLKKIDDMEDEFYDVIKKMKVGGVEAVDTQDIQSSLIKGNSTEKEEVELNKRAAEGQTIKEWLTPNVIFPYADIPSAQHLSTGQLPLDNWLRSPSSSSSRWTVDVSTLNIEVKCDNDTNKTETSGEGRFTFSQLYSDDEAHEESDLNIETDKSKILEDQESVLSAASSLHSSTRNSITLSTLEENFESRSYTEMVSLHREIWLFGFYLLYMSQFTFFKVIRVFTKRFFSSKDN